MSIETRLRETGPRGGGGGGGSSNSGGLAGTGGYYIVASADLTLPLSYVPVAGTNIQFAYSGSNFTLSATTGSGASSSAGLMGTANYLVTWSADPLLSNEKVLTAGSSLTIVTDANAIYLNAITNTFAGSGGLASTGGLYAVYSASPLFPNSRIITAGSSVTVVTDATSIYISAITNAAGGVVYAPTGGFYAAWSSDPLLTNEKVITAGSSMTISTDASNIYFTAITNTFAGSGGLLGTANFLVAWSSDPLMSNEKVLSSGSSASIRTDATAIYVDASTAGLAFQATAINTTFPLSGGGDFSTSRTHVVNTAFLVTSNRLINTTSPVGGGGNLGADLTLTVGSLSSLGSANQFLRVNTDGASWGYINFRSGSSTVLSQGSGFIQIDATTGASASSAGLAGTGPFYLLHTSGNGTLPLSKIISAGNNITITTDANAVFIAATTGVAASSGGLMGTGGFFVAWSSDTTMSSEKVLTAGSSITLVTDSTTIWINALTGGATGAWSYGTLAVGSGGTGFTDLSIGTGDLIWSPSGGTNAFSHLNVGSATTLLGVNSNSNTLEYKTLTGSGGVSIVSTLTGLQVVLSNTFGYGVYELLVQQAKLYASTSAARIDAGTPTWRLLYSMTTQQFGIWQFLIPQNYGSNPRMRLVYGQDSNIGAAKSIAWIIDQWAYTPGTTYGPGSGLYTDTYGTVNSSHTIFVAGFSAGMIQSITVPLVNTVSFIPGNLVKLRVSGSGGLLSGNSELYGLNIEWNQV